MKIINSAWMLYDAYIMYNSTLINLYNILKNVKKKKNLKKQKADDRWPENGVWESGQGNTGGRHYKEAWQNF